MAEKNNGEKEKKSPKFKNNIENAKPGDMIEFVRGVHYSHWGLYTGEDWVVHRWGENDGVGRSVGFIGNFLTFSGTRFDKATILQSKISDVLSLGGTVNVNNYLDDQYEPLPVDVILNNARRALYQEGYNLIYQNCEHFATECRYGEPNSRQVKRAVGLATSTVVAMLGLGAGILYLMSKAPDQEEEKEKNVD